MVSEDAAVSPVISVILMVAIVVILGAVVSVFALSLGESATAPAPNADFEFETLEDGDVRITHASGDALEGSQLRFAGAALEKTTFGSLNEWNGNTVTASDSATVNVKGGHTLRLIWQSSERDEATTLAEYDVPNRVDPKASIGTVSADYFTWLRGELTIENVQFTRVENERVYVVAEDDPSGGSATNETYFSTSGEDLSVRVRPDSNIEHGETITVTVYETDSKLTKLAAARVVVP